MYPHILQQDFAKGTIENFDVRANFQTLRLQDMAAVGDLQSCGLSESWFSLQTLTGTTHRIEQPYNAPPPTHRPPHLVETASTG